jgi:hypothetical protein
MIDVPHKVINKRGSFMDAENAIQLRQYGTFSKAGDYKSIARHITL